jgi:hypothetical protein
LPPTEALDLVAPPLDLLEEEVGGRVDRLDGQPEVDRDASSLLRCAPAPTGTSVHVLGRPAILEPRAT